jgi:iron complex transport system permease protein
MSRNARILFVLLAVLLLAVFGSICLGASGIAPEELMRAVFSGNRESAAARIFWYVRLPRILAAMLAGGALSVSGMLLQSVLRNPLAAPGVIGINSGAGLSALVCMALFPSMAHMVPLAAFAGACASAFAVYLLARLTGASRFTIVLAGIAVNSIFGACMDAIVTIIPDAVVSRSAFAIGGFANVTMRQLGFAAPLCLIAVAAALLLSRELGVMALGDEVAHSLGLRVERFRAVFLITAAMLSGAAVSFAGLIGFVGLIAPHMARMICKNDVHLQLPITMVFGAALCLVCDLVARTAFSPYELPVGIVLSFLGAPFFLYLLLTGKRSGRHDED